MVNVKYCGTFTDYSGYGQANRTFITALFLAQVGITTEVVVQVPERSEFGWAGQLCSSLEGKSIPYKTKIIHLTPDMYPRYMEDGKHHIGHLFWETNKLPKEWVKPCNMMDEIWTASESQAEMIRKSGVKVPIYWFPQPIDATPAEKNLKPFIIPNFKGFVFYSIFQWIERKNPKALITNYWRAFEGKTDVVLVLKTYRVNYTAREFEFIKDEIRSWRREVKVGQFPRILLVKNLMPTEKLFRLHATGQCYINTSRGEGWCIPAVEAALMGNPIISVDQTGFTDYFDRDMFYPCNAKQTPVTEQPWIPWYTRDQQWLEIYPQDLVKQMLMVYNHQKEAKKVGNKAQTFVADNFNYWAVGEAMKRRLEEIENAPKK